MFMNLLGQAAGNTNYADGKWSYGKQAPAQGGGGYTSGGFDRFGSPIR
jgi:hypothetical protein